MEYKQLVKMRLSRGGRKKKPYYHIVVIDSRRKREGRYIEMIGYYNPMARDEEEEYRLDEEKVKKWYGRGARPTGKVMSLIKKQGIDIGGRENKVEGRSKAEKETEETEETGREETGRTSETGREETGRTSETGRTEETEETGRTSGTGRTEEK